MFVLVNGERLDVGERSAIEGRELRALAAVGADRELWHVVPDPGARYQEMAVPALAVHDERVRDATVVLLGSTRSRVHRFFTTS